VNRFLERGLPDFILQKFKDKKKWVEMKFDYFAIINKIIKFHFFDFNFKQDIFIGFILIKILLFRQLPHYSLS
jgi:hypothetical protein